MKKKVLLGIILALTVVAAPAMAHEEEDPVCGMKVDVDTSKWKSQYAGRWYYF